MNAKYAGWMRNNPWEPWGLMIPGATEPGDAIHAMRSLEDTAKRRGGCPSLVAMPIGMHPDGNQSKAIDAAFESFEEDGCEQ